MNIIDALHARQSTRAYLDTPVERDTVEKILNAARWAPSETNMQPWQVCVVSGTTLKQLSEAILAARAAGEPPARITSITR